MSIETAKISKKELIKELEKITKEGTKRAKRLGIKQSDIPKLVHRIRKEKMTSKTFLEITKPLKEEAKKVYFKEKSVPSITKKVRAKENIKKF